MKIDTVIQANRLPFQLLIPLFIQLMGLTIAVCMDEYLNRRQRRILLTVSATVLLLILQNFLEYGLVVGEPHVRLRTWVAILGYCIRPLILVQFLGIVHPTGKRLHAWALIGLNTAVSMSALFSHLAFWIDEGNRYHSGPLRYFCLVVSMLLLGELVYHTMTKYQEKRKKEMWLPLFAALIILGGCVLDCFTDKSLQPVEYLTIAVVISCTFYYIWLHLQFVREHEQALQAEQRIQIMMSQIQPHFLFNTIATIRALCRRDAEKAGHVAEIFGDYLRQNLDSLGINGLIPFQKELEHTKVYAEIEMVRFENIRVEYDIQEDGFSVPPLTVQPLVENAIRHGVRILDEGVVTVSTRRCPEGYEITVRDNGQGFDVDGLNAQDGTHIGLQNVRERIEKMSGGRVRIESAPGAGTRVTLTIPEQR